MFSKLFSSSRTNSGARGNQTGGAAAAAAAQTGKRENSDSEPGEFVVKCQNARISFAEVCRKIKEADASGDASGIKTIKVSAVHATVGLDPDSEQFLSTLAESQSVEELKLFENYCNYTPEFIEKLLIAINSPSCGVKKFHYLGRLYSTREVYPIILKFLETTRSVSRIHLCTSDRQADEGLFKAFQSNQLLEEVDVGGCGGLLGFKQLSAERCRESAKAKGVTKFLTKCETMLQHDMACDPDDESDKEFDHEAFQIEVDLALKKLDGMTNTTLKILHTQKLYDFLIRLFVGKADAASALHYYSQLQSPPSLESAVALVNGIMSLGDGMFGSPRPRALAIYPILNGSLLNENMQALFPRIFKMTQNDASLGGTAAVDVNMSNVLGVEKVLAKEMVKDEIEALMLDRDDLGLSAAQYHLWGFVQSSLDTLSPGALYKICQCEPLASRLSAKYGTSKITTLYKTLEFPDAYPLKDNDVAPSTLERIVAERLQNPAPGSGATIVEDLAREELKRLIDLCSRSMLSEPEPPAAHGAGLGYS